MSHPYQLRRAYLEFIFPSEACDKNTYEYIRSNPNRSPSLAPLDTSTTKSTNPALHIIEEIPSKPPTPEPASEKEEEDDKFKLILRAKDVKDITLTVRPTTKCSAIIRAYLKSAGLADKFAASAEPAPPPPTKGRGRGRGKKAAPLPPPMAAAPPMPVLMLDGDKLEPESEIGACDLEDGDMVEVFGV